jgi:hypothetical protein
MASDQTHILSTESQLSLVDIEELRKMLGAEANLGASSGTPRAGSTVSTVMCPTHPWDQGSAG